MGEMTDEGLRSHSRQRDRHDLGTGNGLNTRMKIGKQLAGSADLKIKVARRPTRRVRRYGRSAPSPGVWWLLPASAFRAANAWHGNDCPWRCYRNRRCSCSTGRPPRSATTDSTGIIELV